MRLDVIQGMRHEYANIHALVKLNVFAVMMPVEAEKTLKEITPSFSSYLK